jgi:hypothetical protein
MSLKIPLISWLFVTSFDDCSFFDDYPIDDYFECNLAVLIATQPID